MDVESYDLLLIRAKECLKYDLSRKAFIATQLSPALEECNTCVYKGLELVTKLLKDSNVQVDNLCNYIEDVISLLRLLSDFIKNVIECAAMACCNMSQFPTRTGNIILTVFMHCKDSESIYGDNLKHVETQLKDLFRTCHELQLTYLMTLEKHFIFDLSERAEQDILLTALDINMKIGEIVQTLDIKTMAEQWKAFTAICEKYSKFLGDKNIYSKCSQLLATTIMDHIKTVIETQQDNKSVVRSLKVVNFIIKILTKVTNIFKHAANSSYEHVVELMVYIYMNNPGYLELTAEKSHQFINLMETNILNPTDGLCYVLLQDERFLEYVCQIDILKLELNIFLGYVVLIIALIKGVVQKTQEESLYTSRKKLIGCVYRILPSGHYWFNMGVKFQGVDGSARGVSYSLYEHLLVHTVALAATFGTEQYGTLETRMYEAVLSTDCYAALFSANLWALLVRLSGDQLACTTISSLLNIYQELGKHKFFHTSPQEINLRYAIRKLFEMLPREEKRVFSDRLRSARASVFDVFESPDVTRKDIDNLIQTMNLAATCSYFENSDINEEYVVKLWSKTCHSIDKMQLKNFDTVETVWYYEYLQALVSFTECIRIKSNKAKCKIHHCMSTMLCSCSTEILLLLFNLFCSLTFNGVDDETQHVIESNFKDTYIMLLRNSETSIRPHLLRLLSQYQFKESFHEVTRVFCEDKSLMKEWKMYCDIRSKFKSTEWKNQLNKAVHYEYTHKCLKVTTDICVEPDLAINDVKANFDLGGFLFDDSDSEEPSRKKAKLEDYNETVTLIEKLENNTLLLCQVEPTTLSGYKKRIADVINKLRNIVS